MIACKFMRQISPSKEKIHRRDAEAQRRFFQNDKNATSLR